MSDTAAECDDDDDNSAEEDHNEVNQQQQDDDVEFDLIAAFLVHERVLPAPIRIARIKKLLRRYNESADVENSDEDDNNDQLDAMLVATLKLGSNTFKRAK